MLSTDGRFVLNIKDHIRNGKRQMVTDWHIETLQSLGLVVVEHVKVPCSGMRIYRNAGARIDYESVLLLGRGRTTGCSRIAHAANP